MCVLYVETSADVIPVCLISRRGKSSSLALLNNIWLAVSRDIIPKVDEMEIPAVFAGESIRKLGTVEPKKIQKLKVSTKL